MRTLTAFLMEAMAGFKPAKMGILPPVYLSLGISTAIK